MQTPLRHEKAPIFSLLVEVEPSIPCLCRLASGHFECEHQLWRANHCKAEVSAPGPDR